MDERRRSERRQHDQLLTDKEVADLAKVPADTVKYWRRTGVLPYVRLGKHPRVWLSVFQKAFQKPVGLSSLEISGSHVEYVPLRALGGQHGKA
ncbi:MAG: helix-turn-helix domain-containing protein [Deltaproteobacteria bacterium]|nr:helix-turn-helix domain-containing protein [Deltaproteobacteria bacterium]